MLKAGVERDPDAICAETVQLVRERIGPVAALGAPGELQGLVYPSAHNGEPAVALYERGRAGIEVAAGHDAPLSDPAVLAAVRRVALDHGLVVLPLS